MTRTSQLQIRISPTEKLTLKRLAAATSQSVSAYVLSRALPPTADPVGRALDALRSGTSTLGGAIEEIRRSMAGLGPADLEAALGRVRVSGLPPASQNYVAAAAEQMAADAGLPPPRWTAGVRPLERPHFRWPLASLRPYQLRLSSAALKRRNLFDPAILPATSSPPALLGEPHRSRLQQLGANLVSLELEVEFYFIEGTVIHQLLPRRGGSARPDRLLRHGRRGDPLAEFTASRPWPPSWASEAVIAVNGTAYAEMPGVSVFSPPSSYALATKLAALTRGDPHTDEDLRFLLRRLGLNSAADAVVAVSPFLSERQLASDARAVLAALLGA